VIDRLAARADPLLELGVGLCRAGLDLFRAIGIHAGLGEERG